MSAGWSWLIVAAAMLATSAALLVGAALIEARKERQIREERRIAERRRIWREHFDSTWGAFLDPEDMAEIRRRRMARGDEP